MERLSGPRQLCSGQVETQCVALLGCPAPQDSLPEAAEPSWACGSCQAVPISLHGSALHPPLRWRWGWWGGAASSRTADRSGLPAVMPLALGNSTSDGSCKVGERPPGVLLPRTSTTKAREPPAPSPHRPPGSTTPGERERLLPLLPGQCS